VKLPSGRTTAVAHERLAIVDPLSGNQPLYSHDGSKVLTVNGEIYNHLELKKNLKDQTNTFCTASDCEVIVHLYDEVGEGVAAKLDGDFAFVIVDDVTGEVYAARDPVGVNSMYYGRGVDGSTWFASEVKPLVAGNCISIEAFPPGHYYTSKTGTFTKYYSPAWLDSAAATAPLDLPKLRDTFVKVFITVEKCGQSVG
jgi:asparagine synthase (glutamine-hydrolysing)